MDNLFVIFTVFLNIMIMGEVMNKIWGYIISVSIIFSLLTGNASNINNSIYTCLNSATEYIISIIFLMAFWSGINNIILNTKIKEYLKRILKPMYKIIYGKSFKEDVVDSMCINTFGNLFGIGNVSTVSGINVIEKLEKEMLSNQRRYKEDELSDDIIIFVLLNTVSIQILPITVINIRYTLGSENVSKVIIYVWIVSICSFCFLLLITKIYLRIRRYGSFRKND